MREQIQLLVSAAAMSAATQLNALSQSVAPFPESSPRDPATPPAKADVLSLPRLVGGIALGQAAVIVRREVAFGVVPDLERRLLVIANRIPVNTLSAEEAVRRWEGIRLAPDELWVDIGSGNGNSLGRLARKHRARFIGVDTETSVELGYELATQSRFLDNLPENVRYVLLSWNRIGLGPLSHRRLEQNSLMGRWLDRTSQDDRISAATVHAIGEGTASVVSFIFPYLHSKPRSLVGRLFSGPVPQTLDYQMRTAVQLLRPGGLGVIFLETGRQGEEGRLVERVLNGLRGRPEVASIEVATQPIEVERLGVAPYDPHNKEGRPVSIEPFYAARPLFFRRKT